MIFWDVFMGQWWRVKMYSLDYYEVLDKGYVVLPYHSTLEPRSHEVEPRGDLDEVPHVLA